MTDRLNDLLLAWAGAKWRARIRREIDIWRYRLAVRIGGWPLVEAQAEQAADRSSLMRARELHEDTCPLARGDVLAPAFSCHMCEALGLLEADESPRRALLRELTQEAIEAGSYGEPAPVMRPVSVESEGNDGFCYVCVHCNESDCDH